MTTSTLPRHALREDAGALSTTALAALCKAAAEPLRLAILRLLARESFGVLELARMLDCTQSRMSHHLKVLADAGLVLRRREGNSIFYRRSNRARQAELEGLQMALLAAADALPLDAGVVARREQVQAERAERSRQFFEEHASAFRQHQEQVVEYELYGLHAARLLDQLFPEGGRLALEIGPGEGQFLGELSRRFERVLALDNAPRMLARARQHLAAEGLDNVELLAGDTGHPGLPGLAAECAVLNMVLHHVPSPAALFADLADALAPGGVLVVTELCRHDQAWTQALCGDLWLGFEPEELDHWAAAAGLSEDGDGIYLAQRNGFQVQIRPFRRPAFTDPL